MALYPKDFQGKDRLQPGARGEIFQADLPGYRNQGDRINRTQMRLNVSAHDVPNIKYQFDYRLPVLFRYGFAYGYNQIVIPKGRIVAVDPYMDLVDFDMRKQHNTLTLANGGAPVRIRKQGDKYPVFGGETDIVSQEAQGADVHGMGKEWTPLVGMDKAYTAQAYRPFAVKDEEGNVEFKAPMAQLNELGYQIDSETGKVVKNGQFADDVRPGNIPIGIIERNEYTRDDDAFNGMMPGPVLTDALVELPWFSYKDKAEQNPWGSAYGNLFPGALVKSDENGRFVVSPLSFEEELKTMSIAEYELERQQVVGQVYSVNNELLPEGAARWATWALEDRLRYEGFNPEVWPQSGRRGEDAVAHSPYKSTGEYPGYPYDRAYSEHDLHMLASTGRLGNYRQQMDEKYRLDRGIPGLTDGYNAVVREYPAVVVGYIHKADEGQDYVDMYFRAPDTNLESMTIQVGNAATVDATVGQKLLNGSVQIKYADATQGIIVLEVIDKDKLNQLFSADGEGNVTPFEVKIGYKKRGLAGVPTFMDWDGCVGSVKILLTK